MRNISQSVIALLGNTVIIPVVLLDLQFANETQFVWSGIGSLTYNRNVYQGVGKLGKISPITETAEIMANGISLSLSGIPPDVVNDSLRWCRMGLTVNVWFGLLDQAGNVVVSAVKMFTGRFDSVSLKDGATACTITITAESRLADLQRPRIRRFTNDDQQRTSPGDYGFQYVPNVQTWNGAWGSNVPSGRETYGIPNPVRSTYHG